MNTYTIIFASKDDERDYQVTTVRAEGIVEAAVAAERYVRENWDNMEVVSVDALPA